MTAALWLALQSNWRDDRELAGQLRQNGVVRQGEHTIAYYQAGALSDTAMSAFSALLDHGVVDIAGFAGVAAPDRKITWYISGKVEISRARGWSVYLPLERVRTDAAPYLHEITHVLLPCNDCPLWLSEGYASFVQSYVSEHAGGYDGQIFTSNGNIGVDRDAAGWLKDKRGKAMLPYVGTAEEEPDLSDRQNAAAPFYVLSQSLVKFLIAQTGLKNIHAVGALKDLAPLREKWLATLQG